MRVRFSVREESEGIRSKRREGGPSLSATLSPLSLLSPLSSPCRDAMVLDVKLSRSDKSICVPTMKMYSTRPMSALTY